MKNISMIAAVGKNLELGRDNQLIWKFKEDLNFFKEKTMGKPIVMGHNTFISLPKLLPGRLHIVLTSRDVNLGNQVLVVHSIDELLDLISNYPEVMIIGGASIYKQMLSYSDKMYLTEIDDSCFDADAFFPQYDASIWDKKIISSHEENNIKYKHLEYIRK